jgi:6-phosphogluconate dehydrogenase (decarboxylating)
MCPHKQMRAEDQSEAIVIEGGNVAHAMSCERRSLRSCLLSPFIFVDAGGDGGIVFVDDVLLMMLLF